MKVDESTLSMGYGPSDQPALAPRRLGPYRILRWVGAGGMGVVYEAIDEERGARVALKTLLAMAPGALFRFKQEYRSLADLAHINLATLYELMAIDDTWFFTMEFVDGVNFLEYVWGGSAPPPGPGLPPDAEARLRAALRQLAIGVETLHAASLLHVDLKPANVLVEPSGRVVILDFGLVQSLDRERGESSEGELTGTPLYISPEQVLGAQPGRASDWYAVGVMLFQALTGTPPFDGGAMAVLMARTYAPAPDAASRRPGLPADLTALCSELLAQEPAQRAGGRQVLAACEGAREPSGSSPEHTIRTPLIGRDGELAELHRLCDGGAPGEPLCVFVEGASGIGKTALIGELLARLESECDALVLRGRCYERESVPFKGFDAIVDALCRKLTALPPARQREILDADIHHTARIFSVLNDLEVLASVPKPASSQLEPHELRLRAFTGLKRALRQLARRRRVVLFIDDLHWADADSAHLLRELLVPPEPPILVVIAAYREDETRYSPFLHELRAQQRAQGAGFHERTLVIGPLAPHGAEELARACLGSIHDADRAVAVAREAGGIPFFIEAMARYGAGAPAEPTDAAPLPSLDRLIEMHLQDMPAAARRMLQVVAIAARPIEQGLALAAADLEGDAPAVLARLRAARLLRTRGVRGTDLVESYHDRIRQHIAGTLAAPVLIEIHGRLATVLEATQAAPPEVLAYHLHGAGELRRATEYAKRAAREAVAALAFERAAELFADVLRWGAVMQDEAREILIERAQALFNAGRCGDAAKVYLEAAQGAAPAEHRELRRRAAEAFLYGGHLDDGLQVARSLLDEVGLAFPGSQRRALLGIVGQLAYVRLRGIEFTQRPEHEVTAEELFHVDLCWSLGKGLGNVLPPEGTYFMVLALVRALRLGEPKRIGRGLAFIGGTVLSQWPIGERYLETAERLGREHEDPYLTGLPLIMRGFTHFAYTARWKTALELVNQGIEILRTTSRGISWEHALGTGIAFKALEAMGEIGELGRRAVVWRRESEERGDRFAQVVASLSEALAMIGRGNIEGARRHDRRAISLWSNDGYTTQHFGSFVLRLYCELYEGRQEAAWELFHRELPQLERAYFLKIPISRVAILYLQACLQIDRARARPGEREGLLRAAARIGKRLGKEQRVDGRVHATLIEAGIAAARGQRASALALLEQCRHDYRGIDMLLMSACVERRLGELSGNSSLVASGDAESRRLGVAEPARWAEAYVPRFTSAPADS
jgi:hypothetical protein